MLLLPRVILIIGGMGDARTVDRPVESTAVEATERERERERERETKMASEKIST